MKKYISSEIETELATLKEWLFDGTYLCKEYKFKNFVEAFGFMTQVALISESIGHHPGWSNVYNRVTIKLNTHDADAITDKDFLLANRIDGIMQ